MTLLSEIITKRAIKFTRADTLSYALIGVWLLVMIAFPIAFWAWGETIIPTAMTIAAVCQAIAVFYIVYQAWGAKRAVSTLMIVVALAWVAEALGSKTGFPFGEYAYTPVLQPQIWGVPALVPLAWFMLLPSAWALAQTIVGSQRKSWQRKLMFMIVSAVALTAWDLFLDPQMVGWNFWKWAQPSGYFGIPWSNYVGWLLVAGIITLIANPPQLPILPLAVVYACVWFLQTIGLAVFWGQPAPALCGAIAMGVIIVWAYLRGKGTSQ